MTGGWRLIAESSNKMSLQENEFSQTSNLLLASLALIALLLTSEYSYLLFHTLAELFSIIIGITIFILAWNFRRFYQDSFQIFIGVAFLSFSFIDLLHTLAFKGMGVFPGYDANLPTQLWVAARYLQSLALLAAPLFIGRRVKFHWLLGGFALVTALLLLSIFAWNIFPVCYVEGVGLTGFKIASEYVIDGILVAAIVTLIALGRGRHDRTALRYLVVSIVVTIASELAFTFYIGVYDVSNLLGHLLKILASFLVYKASIESEAGSIYASMAELRAAEQALRQSELSAQRSLAQLQSVYALSPVGLCFFDPELRFQTINAEMAGLNGQPIEAHLGRRLCEVAPAAIYDCIEPLVRQALEGGRPLLNEEISWGEGAWLFSASPAVAPDGRKLGVNCVMQDIRERRAAEQALETAHSALQEYAHKLQHSNQELEQFAYVASHDLKEPLRKIIFFSGSVQEMLGAGPPSQAGDYLRRMQRAAERMQKMIDGLLELSRINTRGGAYAPVELTQLAQEAAGDLAALVRDTGGQVLIDELPSAEVDGLQMRRLFQNFIGNGLKFHRADTAPIVRISRAAAHTEDGSAPFVAIRIEDNGIGFDPAHAERLFLPFQRLHGMNEYEGTGLGLAICHKIVERHHGRIEASSRPGAGSIFTIILPARQSDQTDPA